MLPISRSTTRSTRAMLCLAARSLIHLKYRSTGSTAKFLQCLATLRASCCKYIAVCGRDVKHRTSPASLCARWTLKGIRLSAVDCTFLTRRIHISCLCWWKERPDSTFRLCVKICTFFFSSNTTCVVFIGELACYNTSGVLGRNYTRCQKSVCLKIPNTDLLTRSQCIRELLDVRGCVIDIPGLDIDEILTTINGIYVAIDFRCALFVIIFYDLKIHHCHHRVIMHIILPHFINKCVVFILYSYMNCSWLCANTSYDIMGDILLTILSKTYKFNCNMVSIIQLTIQWHILSQWFDIKHATH